MRIKKGDSETYNAKMRSRIQRTAPRTRHSDRASEQMPRTGKPNHAARAIRLIDAFTSNSRTLADSRTKRRKDLEATIDALAGRQ